MTQQKYLTNNAGALQEVKTVEVSAGAGDANKIPNTGTGGYLDPSLLNAVATSAGAGSSGKIPQLDGTGRLDSSMMPVGIVADTITATATEALSAGAYVQVYNASGKKVRNADCSNGRAANGIVLASVSNGGTATVYGAGSLNTQVSARTPGAMQFLSTAGAATEAAPTTSGYIVQPLGWALDVTVVEFVPGPLPITLA